VPRYLAVFILVNYTFALTNLIPFLPTDGWNTLQIGSIVEQLRREGERVEEADLALTSPLLRRHLNPFGRYHFDLERLRRES